MTDIFADLPVIEEETDNEDIFSNLPVIEDQPEQVDLDVDLEPKFEDSISDISIPDEEVVQAGGDLSIPGTETETGPVTAQYTPEQTKDLFDFGLDFGLSSGGSLAGLTAASVLTGGLGTIPSLLLMGSSFLLGGGLGAASARGISEVTDNILLKENKTPEQIFNNMIESGITDMKWSAALGPLSKMKEAGQVIKHFTPSPLSKFVSGGADIFKKKADAMLRLRAISDTMEKTDNIIMESKQKIDKLSQNYKKTVQPLTQKKIDLQHQIAEKSGKQLELENDIARLRKSFEETKEFEPKNIKKIDNKAKAIADKEEALDLLVKKKTISNELKEVGDSYTARLSKIETDQDTIVEKIIQPMKKSFDDTYEALKQQYNKIGTIYEQVPVNVTAELDEMRRIINTVGLAEISRGIKKNIEDIMELAKKVGNNEDLYVPNAILFKRAISDIDRAIANSTSTVNKNTIMQNLIGIRNNLDSKLSKATGGAIDKTNDAYNGYGTLQKYTDFIVQERGKVGSQMSERFTEGRVTRLIDQYRAKLNKMDKKDIKKIRSTQDKELGKLVHITDNDIKNLVDGKINVQELGSNSVDAMYEVPNLLILTGEPDLVKKGQAMYNDLFNLTSKSLEYSELKHLQDDFLDITEGKLKDIDYKIKVKNEQTKISRLKEEKLAEEKILADQKAEFEKMQAQQAQLQIPEDKLTDIKNSIQQKQNNINRLGLYIRDIQNANKADILPVKDEMLRAKDNFIELMEETQDIQNKMGLNKETSAFRNIGLAMSSGALMTGNRPLYSAIRAATYGFSIKNFVPLMSVKAIDAAKEAKRLAMREPKLSLIQKKGIIKVMNEIIFSSKEEEQ